MKSCRSEKQMESFKYTTNTDRMPVESFPSPFGYPRLQKQSSTGAGGGGIAVLNQQPLRQDHLAFLQWDAVWFELERHKRGKAYYNVVLSPDELKSLAAKSWWYDLFIPPGYLEFRFDRLPLWQ